MSIGSTDREITIRSYGDIDTARRQQQQFDSMSLLGEMHARGGANLHSAQTVSDVRAAVRQEAPLDGLRLIDDYEDGRDHWEVPLLAALVDERYDVARELIVAGANVDASCAIRLGDGTVLAHTPLHMAVAREQADAVLILINAAADVNRQDSNGWTPLHYAASDDNTELVQALLRAGAIRDIATWQGIAPRDLAGPETRRWLA